MTSAALTEKTEFPLKLRLYLMMLFQYFVQGSYLPIISVYLQDALGFNSDQLGIFGAALAVGPAVAPFIIGQLVDRHLATQHVLAACHLLGGVIMLALYYQTEFWPVVILGALYSALYIPSLMLTNSLAFYHLRDRDGEFPRVRLWGTIGFVVPAWVVELYFLKGLTGTELNEARGIVLLLAAIGGFVMAFYSLTLPHTPPQKKEEQRDLAPGKVLALLRHRYFFVLITVSFVVAVSHKFFFVWNSPFLKSVLSQQGITGAWEQRISSLGQVFEVVVMACLAVILKRLGFKRTLLVGTAAYILRSLVFAIAVCIEGHFPLVMTLICMGQALHGFCFGCFLATAYMFVDRVSPSDVRGSMQNFYGTFVIGVGMFLGGFVSGRIGNAFTGPADSATFRDRLGIVSELGMAKFTSLQGDASVEFLRDWAGIWLSGAAIGLIALVGLVVGFPRSVPQSPDELETTADGSADDRSQDSSE